MMYDDFLGLIDEYRKEQKESGEHLSLGVAKDMKCAPITAQTVYGQPYARDPGVIKIETTFGWILLDIVSVQAGMYFADEVLSACQRLTAAGRFE